MLVQVRRAGIGGERRTFSPAGRQQNHFPVAGIHVSRERRGNPAAGQRLAENQVAVGEINLEVFFDDGDVANAIALAPVELVFMEGSHEVGRSPG
jgi:hypothetical protein